LLHLKFLLHCRVKSAKQIQGWVSVSRYVRCGDFVELRRKGVGREELKHLENEVLFDYLDCVRVELEEAFVGHHLNHALISHLVEVLRADRNEL